MKNISYYFIAMVCFLGINAAFKKGQIVPDFQLSDEKGVVHSLSQYDGKKVALLFYPNGSEPYCKMEAEKVSNEFGPLGSKVLQRFQDKFRGLEPEMFSALKNSGIVVLAINGESAEDHLELKNQLRIPFPLLTGDKKFFKSFGVDGWFGAVNRKTFLIEKGRFVNVIENVEPGGHHRQILVGFMGVTFK